MTKTTEPFLIEEIKTGGLYITNFPDSPVGFGRHVYVNKETGDSDFPFSGVVFNVPGLGDIEIHYTRFGQVQDSENIRQFAIKEKSTYCADL